MTYAIIFGAFMFALYCTISALEFGVRHAISDTIDNWLARNNSWMFVAFCYIQALACFLIVGCAVDIKAFERPGTYVMLVLCGGFMSWIGIAPKWFNDIHIVSTISAIVFSQAVFIFETWLTWYTFVPLGVSMIGALVIAKKANNPTWWIECVFAIVFYVSLEILIFI